MKVLSRLADFGGVPFAGSPSGGCQNFIIGSACVKLPRRKFLHLTAAVAALPAAPHLAWALDYPTRPVHLIVGFPPGGAADLIARLIGQWLSERLGQQFVIENRTGASSNIAAEMVVRASSD